ncbi:MAG: chemotaxis protein [Bdellovibrionaceae bacterium]|nr:chemotaxis protein [Pseudobdellovibrionaceae bacterium]|tara:strand:- start:29455 stop:31392 length:1938 start_codon:yes stop_codon:yes gene_type:complete
MFSVSSEEMKKQSTQLGANYFAALEALNTNVFVCDTNFNINFVNAKARQVMASIANEVKSNFNVDANQLLGVNIDSFHADRKQSIRSKLQNPNNFPIQSEITFSGLILALQIEQVIQNNKLIGYVVNWEEISKQKAVADEAARAKQVFENVPMNIMVANLDGIITELNPKSVKTLKSIEHLLPVKVEDIEGGSYDVFHKDPAHQRKLLADPNNLPYRALIKLGDETLDLNASPLYDNSGNYLGPMVTWEVVTEKLQNENRVATNQQMLEYAPVNMMRCDLDYNITYLNDSSRKTLKSIESLLPIKADAVLGSSIDIFHKNPAHQRKLLADPSNLPYSTKIQLGNETLKLQAYPLYDKDEKYLGPMVNWSVITDREILVDRLTETSLKLSAASEQLQAAATQMMENAENTTSQASTAATASEEVSAGIANVAASMEEMSSSIREITEKTNESSSRSDLAKSKTQSTNKTINLLGESSQDIGNVIKVISSIAQQTNLLALNATIEAARAGEAGKGFAVVANEVKELAKETAEATQEITKKIEAIQNDSGSAVNAIAEVSEAIETLSEISTNIAASVEEQAATTNEVARVSSEATSATNEITRNVNEMVKMAENTVSAAKETGNAAANLASLAASLNDLVNTLKDDDE